MHTITKTINVKVPVSAAYNQWTQFEDFPQFMEGIREVRQLDDKHLHWKAEVGNKKEEWDAEITEQIPDKRISWRSTSGKETLGLVTFDPVDSQTTQVTVEMGYDPEGIIENVGDKLGFVSRKVEKDLKHFKEFIESRQMETGAWRGTI